MDLSSPLHQRSIISLVKETETTYLKTQNESQFAKHMRGHHLGRSPQPPHQRSCVIVPVIHMRKQREVNGPAQMSHSEGKQDLNLGLLTLDSRLYPPHGTAVQSSQVIEEDSILIRFHPPRGPEGAGPISEDK